MPADISPVLNLNSTVVLSNFASTITNTTFDDSQYDGSSSQYQLQQLQQVQNNQKSQKEDSTLKWLLVVLGVIAAGFVIYAGTHGHKKVSEEVKNKPEVSQSHKEEPINTDAENNVEKLAKQVMIPGNGGYSCHTMATLNALRLHYTLNNQEIPSNLSKDWAFEKLKEAHKVYRDLLLENGLIEYPRATLLIPSIIINKLGLRCSEIPIIDHSRTKAENAKKVIQDLRNNKPAVLLMAARGNHFVTCYGIVENNELISSGLIPRPLGRNIIMKWGKKVNMYTKAIMYRY